MAALVLCVIVGSTLRTASVVVRDAITMRGMFMPRSRCRRSMMTLHRSAGQRMQGGAHALKRKNEQQREQKVSSQAC